MGLTMPTLIDKDEEILFGFPSEDLHGRIIRMDEGYVWLGDVEYNSLQALGELILRIQEQDYGVIVPASKREIYLLCEGLGMALVEINQEASFIS